MSEDFSQTPKPKALEALKTNPETPPELSSVAKFLENQLSEIGDNLNAADARKLMKRATTDDTVFKRGEEKHAIAVADFDKLVKGEYESLLIELRMRSETISLAVSTLPVSNTTSIDRQFFDKLVKRRTEVDRAVSALEAYLTNHPDKQI